VGLGLERAGGAAGLIRVLVGAAFIGLVAGCTATPIAPAASPSASPAAVASPNPAPTTAAPSPTPTVRHVNDVLGYAVDVPSPWRVSECLSGLTREGTYLGQDTLTWRTVAEEHDLGGGADTGGSGALTSVITIAAEISSKTPTEYAAAAGGGIGDKVEATTIDGRPALHKVEGASGRATYYVANAGRMYAIGLSIGLNPNEPPPPATIGATFDVIVGSMIFRTPTARPTPTPMPQLSPAVEAVVNAVAAAFAASDADRLRELMPPTCWFSSAGYRSSGVVLSREKMADLIRTSFTQGRKVTVESRPIKTDAPFIRGPFWVWSSWSAYGSAPFTPASAVQLVFDQIDGHWYWIGALFNADELRR
jgi:hypothetical protein